MQSFQLKASVESITEGNVQVRREKALIHSGSLASSSVGPPLPSSGVLGSFFIFKPSALCDDFVLAFTFRNQTQLR